MGALVDRLKQAMSRPVARPLHVGRMARALTVHVSVGRPERNTPTVAEIAKRLMRALRREHRPFARITRAWARVAPAAAGRTQVLSFDHGRLEIGVCDASLRAEMQGFRRLELLEALRAREDGRDVAEIRFKLIGAAPSPSGRGAQEGADDIGAPRPGRPGPRPDVRKRGG